MDAAVRVLQAGGITAPVIKKMHSAKISDLEAHDGAVHARGSGAPVVRLHRLGADRPLRDIAAQELADRYTRIGYDFSVGRAGPCPHRLYRLLRIRFAAAFVAGDRPAARSVCARSDASGEGHVRACEALAAEQIAAPTLQRTIPYASLAVLAPAQHASVLQQPHAFQQRVYAFLG